MARIQDRRRRGFLVGLGLVTLAGLLLLARSLGTGGGSSPLVVTGQDSGPPDADADVPPLEMDGVAVGSDPSADAGGFGVREVIASPRARLAVRVVGVRPVHRGEIRWKLSRRVEILIEPPSGDSPDTGRPWELSDYEIASASAIRITREPDGSSLMSATEAVRDAARPLAESTGETFLFDVVELLAPSTRVVSLVLEAKHPLYSIDASRIAVSEAQLEDLHAGVPLDLECRVDSVGLCALSGTVVYAEGASPRTEPEVPSAVTLPGTGGVAPVEDPVEDPLDRSSVISVQGRFVSSGEELELDNTQFDISNVRINFNGPKGDFKFSQPSARIALFPVIDGEMIPQAVEERTLAQRTDFRFVVEEPGPYVLAIFPLREGDYLPETLHVVLTSAHEKELEAPIVLGPGAAIEGFVDAPPSLGLLGQGVRASLIPAEGDELLGGGAASGHLWNGTRFERAEVVATTDRNGHFRIAPLSPGMHRLEVSWRGVVDVRSPEVQALDSQLVLAPQVGVRCGLHGRSAHVRLDPVAGSWHTTPESTAPQARMTLRHGERGDLLAEMVHPVIQPLQLLVDAGVPLELLLQSKSLESDPLRIEAAGDGMRTEHRLDVRTRGD